MIEWPTLSFGTLVSISARSRIVWGLATRVSDTTSSHGPHDLLLGLSMSGRPALPVVRHGAGERRGGRRDFALRQEDQAEHTQFAVVAAAMLEQAMATGDPAGADVAADLLTAAVAGAPPGHADLPGYLSNLGMALQIRYAHSSDPADLDAAITAYERAAQAAPQAAPQAGSDKAWILANLSGALSAIARLDTAAAAAGLTRLWCG